MAYTTIYITSGGYMLTQGGTLVSLDTDTASEVSPCTAGLGTPDSTVHSTDLAVRYAQHRIRYSCIDSLCEVDLATY